MRPGIFLSALVALLSFIRMGIADKNDNAPYFDKALYEAEVDENEDIQHTVLTVTAEDEDECKLLLVYDRKGFLPFGRNGKPTERDIPISAGTGITAGRDILAERWSFGLILLVFRP